MKLSDKQIELKLCETYFLFVTKFMTSDVSLEKLCSSNKISLDRAKKILPYNYSCHFLKLFKNCFFIGDYGYRASICLK